MPFPNSGATQPTQQNPGAPPPPPVQGNQGTPGAPPPPPAAQGQLPDLYMNQNGQSVMMQGSQLASMPDATQVHHNGDWTTLGAVRTSLGLTSPAPSSQGQASQTRQGGWQQQPGPQGGASPFAGIDGAQTPVARNPYLSSGKYVLHVVSSEYKRGRDHNAQIIEADIIASDASEATAPLAEGIRATCYFKHNDSFLGNMKELVIAASGFDEQGNPRPRDSVVTAAESDQWLNGENPAIVGCLIYCEARNGTTKAGNPFTFYNFWPCKSAGSGPDGKPIPDFDSIPR